MALPGKITISPKFEKLPLRGFIIASMAISLLTVLFGLLANIILPPQIPLFYGFPQTEQQLATALWIILPGGISLIFTVLNAYLSITKLTSENVYLKKALAFTSFLTSILALIATFKIIFLVGAI